MIMIMFVFIVSIRSDQGADLLGGLDPHDHHRGWVALVLVADIAFLARDLLSQEVERSQPGENSLLVHFSCENKTLAHYEIFSAIMTIIVIFTIMMIYAGNVTES